MVRVNTLRRLATLCVMGAAALCHTACVSPEGTPGMARPNVVPETRDVDAPVLTLDASVVHPMFTELLAVDALTVAELAVAENLEIRLARESVVESEGELERTIGSAFPAIVPTFLFEHVEGSVRATQGNIVGVGFDTFSPSVAVQWVINPGRVLSNIAAAKKRLAGAEFSADAVGAETLRRAIVEFYALALTQAQVSAAHQGLLESEELARITSLRTQTGTGVRADELRAKARLAERRQDVVLAMTDFYRSSVALSDTLNMDPGVTLIPSISEMRPTHFVRSDLSIDELMGYALAFRPDLASVREIVDAAVADKDAAWWGQYGPEFAVSYQYGGVMGSANNVQSREGIPGNLIVNPASANGSFSTNPVANGLIKEGALRLSQQAAGRSDESYGLREQQRVTAGAAWRLSLSAFGELKKAGSRERQAAIQGERSLAQIKRDVVLAAKASEAHRELIDLSRQQVDAASEALRLTEANLQAGTMTTLDVLHSQDAATKARLRYAGSVVRYNQSQVNLLAAIGLIDEETVKLALGDTLAEKDPAGDAGP